MVRRFSYYRDLIERSQEDIEYLPSIEAARLQATWGAISCKECQFLAPDGCSKSWKISNVGGILKCIFYKKKVEWIKREDFNV